MRLLHTADWHLGRTLGGHALLDDQAHVLEQVIAVARDTRADLVIVAGDLYDRAVPPADAVRLLDDTLARIVLDLEIPVLAIAGNHDSPDRLAFGGRMLERSGLVLRTGARPAAPFVLADQDGPVEFHGLPYAEPAAVRSALQVDAHDHDAAIRAQIATLARDPTRRAVLVAHAFVAGGEVSESERPLSVGTAGTVGLGAFTGFAYVALGHLHRPQSLAGGRVRYAGSPLKYSVSEASHAKSLSLVEIDAAGAVKVEVIPLVPRRDLRVIRGMLDAILAGPASDDYVMAELDDTAAMLDVHARLTARFPNLIGHTRPFYAAGRLDSRGAAALKRDVANLFADFFTQTTGARMSEAETAAFAAAHDAWQSAERESAEREA